MEMPEGLNRQQRRVWTARYRENLVHGHDVACKRAGEALDLLSKFQVERQVQKRRHDVESNYRSVTIRAV